MRIRVLLNVFVLSSGLATLLACTPVNADGYLVSARRPNDTYHQFSVANFRSFHEARIEVDRLCKRDGLHCFELIPIHNSCAAAAMAWHGAFGWRIEEQGGTDLASAKTKAMKECRDWFDRDPNTPCRITIEVCDRRPTADQAIEPVINAPEQVHVGQLNDRAVSDILADAFSKSAGAEAIMDNRRKEEEQALLRAEAETERIKEQAEARIASENAKKAAEAAAPVATATKNAASYVFALLLPFFLLFYAFAVSLGEPTREPRVGRTGLYISMFLFGLSLSSLYEHASNIQVWRLSFAQFNDVLGGIILLVPVWLLTGRFRDDLKFADYLMAPFSILADIGAFLRGTFFLFSRHPADRVILPALRSGAPIDGEALVRATNKNSNTTLPRKLTSWAQMLRGKKLAEKAEAAAAHAEADRDLHIAAHKLEKLRGEQDAARQAYEALKRRAKERKRKL